MWHTFRHHWPAYASEAAGLAFFMANAAWIGTVLEYPRSPVRRAFAKLGDSPAAGMARRVPLGLAMAAVVLVIVYNPLGRLSGAHVNPAVTVAFWRLGRISTADAAAYVAAQFAGGTVIGLVLAAVLGRPFADPAVGRSTTVPGSRGTVVAFAAEFAMTFVLMAAILTCLTHRRLAPWTGLVVAGVIGTFLIVETPLSGMSLNPARTFGSALAARRWTAAWIYFVAPVLATLLAAEVFARFGDMKTMDAMQTSGLNVGTRMAPTPAISAGDRPVPQYPVDHP